MSVESKNSEETLAPFPNEKNVRITIAGLAVCALKKNPSEASKISFLNHVKYHKLKLQVKRRESGSTTESVFYDHTFTDESEKIELTPSTVETPDNYRHEPQINEHDISEIINLSNNHKIFFERNTSLAIEMDLSNCQFYTKNLTADEYIIFVPDELHSEYTPRQLGEVVGAYMKVDGQIEIYEQTNGTKTKLIECPMTDGNTSYEYEFNFTNHCDTSKPQEIEKCKSAIGSKGSDIRFLYDVIKPSKAEASKMVLLKIKISKKNSAPITSINVAACLPATTEPCDDCT